MADWYLVRHGETRWNAEQRVQGHTDVPLHGHGREQVAGTAARLADVAFHATYSSDLTRARESAEIIIASSNTGPHEAVHRSEPPRGVVRRVRGHDVERDR